MGGREDGRRVWGLLVLSPPHPSLSVCAKEDKGASTKISRFPRSASATRHPASVSEKPPLASVFLAVRLGIDRGGKGKRAASFCQVLSRATDLVA